MCYYGSSSTRQPEPATLENRIKYGAPSTVANSMTEDTQAQLNSDIQRRRRALGLSNNTGGSVMV